MLRLPVFGFHFNDFGHGVELSETFPEVRLVVDPLECVDDGFGLIEIDFLDHWGAFFHLEEFEVVDDIFDVEALLLFEKDDKRNGLKLSFGV